MFQKFDEETQKILKKSKLEMQKLKHPFVGTEHLILSILNNKNNKIANLLNENQIFYDNFKEELINLVGYGNSLNTYFIYTPLLKRVIENAIIDTKEDGKSVISINSLFLSLLDEGEGVAIRILSNLGVNIDELYYDLISKDDTNFKDKNRKKLSIYDYSEDLITKAKEFKIDPVIGRDKEIDRLIEILLRRNKNNPLLIGEAGVGKTAIVEGLALRIYKKEVPEPLLNKKILSVSMANLVAGTKYRGEFEERISKLIKEIENNQNIIIFIDEMHSLVGAGGAEGAIDASNIFKPALARGKIRLIGATTTKEYQDSIEKDKALNRRFQTILIEEPNINETKSMLRKLKPIYEKYHGVSIPLDVLDEIPILADKYIFDRKNPDKSIDILDEVCASCSLKKDRNSLKLDNYKKDLKELLNQKNNYIIKHDFGKAYKLKENEIIIEDKINKLALKSKNQKNVTVLDIANVIKERAHVPVYEIDKEEIKILRNLETTLKKEVLGQDAAIKILGDETKKLKLGLKTSSKPVSFLFTGSSGVGKTMLAKTYAKVLKMPLIRLDMSEYKESHTVSKIIGSPPGYVGFENHNTILDNIKNNPYAIILLDEIEKASPDVLNLFLQILDEGFITGSDGNKIYFNHTIIIMTSNITANKDLIGFNKNKNNSNNIKLETILSKEFISRITHIIEFNELDKEVMTSIIKKELSEIKKKFKMQNINIKIDNKVVEEILELTNYEESGARKIKKVLEEKIDNIVIENILKGVNQINIKKINI